MPRELLMMQNSFQWETAEGQTLEIENAIRSNARDLKIEGQTYQNLLGETKDIEYVSTKSEFNYIYSFSNLKANTIYTLSYEIKSSNEITTNNNTILFRIEKIKADSNAIIMAGFTGTVDNIYRKYKLTFNTGSDTVQTKINLRNCFDHPSIGLTENTLSVRNLVLLEGDYTNGTMITELPTSINGIESVAERESKNLLENVKWHDGWIHGDGSLGNHSGYPNAIYSDLIDINTNNLYYTNIVSYSDVSSLRHRCYDINGKRLNISTGNIKELYTGNSFKPTKKIRILILDKTVTPLPSNPILLPNLYTHGDVNVKGARPWMSTDIELILKPNTRYNYVKTIESISKGSNNVTPVIQLWNNETKTYMTNLDASSFTTQSATNYLIKLIVNNGTASTTDCEANFRNIGIYESDLYKVRLTNKGKNLLNISTFKPISYSTIQTSKNGNVITVKGLKTADVEAYTDAKAGNIKVYLEENKTYSFSFKSDGKYGSAVGTDTVEIFFMLDGTTKKYFKVHGQNTSTIPTGFSGYYYIRFDVNSGDKTHKFWDIQVEEGSVITDYEPYREPTPTEIPLPQPLRSLPNGVCDEVVGNKLIQRVGKSFLNENSNVHRVEVKDSNFVIRIKIADASNKYDYNTSTNLISDKFIVRSLRNESSSYGICAFSQAGGYTEIRILQPTTIIDSVSDVESENIAKIKEWLKNNSSTVYYELATPIEHTLNVPKISIAKGSNIITTANNMKPNLTIKYKKLRNKR